MYINKKNQKRASANYDNTGTQVQTHSLTIHPSMSVSKSVQSFFPRQVGRQELQAANLVPDAYGLFVCCALIGSPRYPTLPILFYRIFYYLRLSVPGTPREGKKAKVSRMVRCVDADPSTRGSLWISAVMYLQLHTSKGDWRVSSTNTCTSTPAESNVQCDA